MKSKLLYLVIFICCFSTTMYSQVFFTGLGDGHSWENPDNWSTTALPQSGDDIIIDGFNVDITNYSPNTYGSLELRNNAHLFTQTDITLSGDFTIDGTSSFEVSVQDVDLFDKVFLSGNYYINGTVLLRYSGHVPLTGDSYQIINGDQGSCGTASSFTVSNTGFDVSIGVECDYDGVYYTVTGVNYTTAIAWDGETGNGLWNSADNWDPNGVPPPNSILIFNQPDDIEIYNSKIKGAAITHNSHNYTKTNGAGITDAAEIFIGRNNTLEVNGDLLLNSYINISKGGTLDWTAGKIYKKNPIQQSLILSYGYINLLTSGIKELDTDVEIWSFFEDINHDQGTLNINNGKVRVFNYHNYNINGDNITIGYNSGSTHELSFGNGSIKKTSGNGTSTINLTTLNNTGNIISEIGTLAITGNLTTEVSTYSTGNYGGNGSIQFPTGFVLDGKISPGNSAGILTVLGDFTSSASSTFNIEINGPTVGSGYDQLMVTDTAILDGTIAVNLGYLPASNASFQILKATTLSSCNFPSQVTANYNSTPYTFNVLCQNNTLYLNGPGVTLSTKDNEIQNLAFYPNPVRDVLNIQSPTLLNGKWDLINPLGKKVKQGLINDNETKIPVADLASGIYLLQIQDSSNQNTKSEKIIIEK